MIKKTLTLMTIVMAFFLAQYATANAGEFAADFKQYSSWEDEDSKQLAGKIFMKGDTMRMEFVRDGQVSEILIMNSNKKKAWMLNPSDNTYMEIPYPEKSWQTVKSGDADLKGGKQTHLGKETVSGYVCEKIGYTYEDEAVGQTVVWMSAKLGYPVKWEQKGGEGKASFQLSKIKEAKLKESLFILPKGYKNIADDNAASDADDEKSEAAKAVTGDAKDLATDARGAAKDEVSNIVTDSIREGIRGLFKK